MARQRHDRGTKPCRTRNKLLYLLRTAAALDLAAGFSDTLARLSIANSVKAHEIFQHLPPKDRATLFSHLQEQDRQAYRACVQLLSSRRKLRTVIVERKPRAEQHEWLAAECARKSNADAAVEVLQTWLLSAHRPMICQFLDDLKIPHDGNGLIETLPAEPSSVRETIGRLLENHSPLAVAIYLHVFAEMDIAHWPILTQLLLDDPRLSLVSQPTTV